MIGYCDNRLAPVQDSFRMKPPTSPARWSVGLLLAACLTWASASAADRRMHSNHAGPAYSHEIEPQHGGAAVEVEDIVYELVLRPDGSTIYVTQYERSLAAHAASGFLTIRSATKTLKARLMPAAANELRAAADLCGMDVKAAVARIGLARDGSETVRFSAKKKQLQEQLSMDCRAAF